MLPSRVGAGVRRPESIQKNYALYPTPSNPILDSILSIALLPFNRLTIQSYLLLSDFL
jgi:hypothetical protein